MATQTTRDAPPLLALRALVDTARDELFALDADGKILEANTAAAAGLGRPRGFLVGKPFAAFVALSDRSVFRASLRDVGGEPLALGLDLEDGGRVAVTLRCVPAGAERVVTVYLDRDPESQARAKAQAPAQAQPARFDLEGFLLRLPQAVVAVDRRGRVVLANRLARSLLAPQTIRSGSLLPTDGAAGEIRKLGDRLTIARAPLPPRTVELDDGRVLRIAGTPAHGEEPAILQIEDVSREWEDDRRKREFIRNAAHQLRTPLAAITSAIDVLDAGAKDDPVVRDRFLAHLRTHANRLARLTRGLLVLARLDAGESARLDLVELRPLLVELAAASPGEVRVSSPPDVAVVADPDLLYEVMAALVENGVKYGRDAVEVTVRVVDGTVEVTVADGGPGILPEHRQHATEPFYRGSAGRDGFGLGLAIASRALQAMGGRLVIGVDTSEDGHVVFHLRAATVVA